MKHRIEYYDVILECNGVWYVECKTLDVALLLFRQSFEKDKYKIVEVAKVYDKDWSKY